MPRGLYSSGGIRVWLYFKCRLQVTLYPTGELTLAWSIPSQMVWAWWSLVYLLMVTYFVEIDLRITVFMRYTRKAKSLSSPKLQTALSPILEAQAGIADLSLNKAFYNTFYDQRLVFTIRDYWLNHSIHFSLTSLSRNVIFIQGPLQFFQMTCWASNSLIW